MGKDVDGACCEACRRFGGDENNVVDLPVKAPEPVPVRADLTLEQVRIVIIPKGGTPWEVAPKGPEVTVGRTDRTEIVLRSGSISKMQCRFVFEEGRCIVVDTKSTCGTYVNGRKMQAQAISVGDVVSCGDFDMRLRRV